jgi:uncharacterized protein YjbI with pentapeptide repeats
MRISVWMVMQVYADLSAASISGANLRNANLRGADLPGASRQTRAPLR